MLRQLWEIFIAFFKIGAFTFGGGYAMLPLIEKEVTDRGWVKKEDIVDVFAISQSVPGVIAVNSSVFIGYRIGGLPTAIAAVLGVVLPSFIVILGIATILVTVKDNLYVQKAFVGIRAGVTVMIALAAYKLGKSVLINKFAYILAIGALIFVLFFDIHPIVVIIVGAILGPVYYLFFAKSKVKNQGGKS